MIKTRRKDRLSKGKDAGTWERFAEQLGKHNGHPKAITQVAIDMSPAYIKGVKENFANAVIVYDKFHVVSQVSQAVEEVRRKEARQDGLAREQLEKTCWLWRKNPEGWTEREEQRWNQLKDKPLVTGLAYAMRLELQQAYGSLSARVARSRFVKWCQWVRMEAEALTNGLLEPMRKAAEMVERHLEGILGHWKEGLTTSKKQNFSVRFTPRISRCRAGAERVAKSDGTTVVAGAMLAHANLPGPTFLECMVETSSLPDADAVFLDALMKKLSFGCTLSTEPVLVTQQIIGRLRNRPLSHAQFLQKRLLRPLTYPGTLAQLRKLKMGLDQNNAWATQGVNEVNSWTRKGRNAGSHVLRHFVKRKTDYYVKKLFAEVLNSLKIGRVVLRAEEGDAKVLNWASKVVYELITKHRLALAEGQRLCQLLRSEGLDFIPTLKIKAELEAMQFFRREKIEPTVG